MPEKQLGFLFSSRKETRGKGRNIFQQTNFFKWMWRDFSKQESQQMIKIKIKILLRLTRRTARHLVDSYVTPFQKVYTVVRRMKERAEFSLNKLTGLILS